MPDWVWVCIVVGFVYERLTKVRVFDFARGFIHIEFAGDQTDKPVKPASGRKRIEK